MFLNLIFLLFVGCQSEDLEKESSSDEIYLEINLAHVRKGVSDLSLQEHEKVWKRVSWVAKHATAKKLSLETNRPIFLFSMHGELDGRC